MAGNVRHRIADGSVPVLRVEIGMDCGLVADTSLFRRTYDITTENHEHETGNRNNRRRKAVNGKVWYFLRDKARVFF